MKRVLITGANRGIGLRIAQKLSAADWEVYGAARNLAGLRAALAGAQVKAAGCLEVDFARRDSLLKFHAQLPPLALDAVVHVASPYSGSIRHSTVAELEGWANFQLGASLLAKCLIDQTGRRRTLVLVGSVAGMLNKTSAAEPLYSAYKGSLRYLAEVARYEGIRAITSTSAVSGRGQTGWITFPPRWWWMRLSDWFPRRRTLACRSI